MDKISIIMPAYNAVHYIEEAINSVLTQTFDIWELIIIADTRSTDDTIGISQKYAMLDTRIKYVLIDRNFGVANARNIGFQNATGRYIAFLDSDDYWMPDKLEKQLRFMKNNKHVFSCTGYRHFSESMTNDIIILPNKEVDYVYALKGNEIACLTVMLDRSVLGSLIHMHDVKHEDYVLWLKILKAGYKAYGLQEDLARYRKSNTSLTSNKMKSAMWTWHIYRDIEAMNIFKALYCFVSYTYKGILKHYYK